MTGIKTGGRAKGTPNKTTADLKLLRENLNNIITNEINNLDIILNGLSNEKRLDYIIKLMPYVMPKLNNIEMTTEQDINLNVEPTEEQIKELKDLILKMEL